MSDPRAYIQMADFLRQKIRDGEFDWAEPIISISEMSKRFGHARPTCAQAMHLLVSEGLLFRVPGHGYYVSPVKDEDTGAWQCGDGHMFRYEPPPSYPPWCGNVKCFAGGFKWIIKDEITGRDWLE